MSRDFQQINVLIPGYSIEDLPTDLNETSAASLLNAFAVAWHPQLLSRSVCIPDAKQAESTELPTGQHIVLIPECSEDWLGHDWQEQLDNTLSVVLSDCSSRDEWLKLIDEKFPAEKPLCPDLLADFLAFGTVHLQIALLSRRMHHYVDPDQYLLENEALAAADAAIAGDNETGKEHLRRCFECLLECREQFYPVDAYLVDMCLTADHDDSQTICGAIDTGEPISLISTGRDFRKRFESDETFATSVRSGLDAGKLSLMIGHHDELRLSLGSLSATSSDIGRFRSWLAAELPEIKPVWARRRFGIAGSLPALLKHHDFAGALHVVLDDGLYPDREHGTFSWEGPDGTRIPAASRIPMAIDGASGFLRFADRMTESMQDDSNAVILFARLPNVTTPWLGDLKRAAAYGPLPAQFVTMNQLLEETAESGSSHRYDDAEYLSPCLIQSSVLKTEAPISSPAVLNEIRQKIQVAAFVRSLRAVLKPAKAECGDIAKLVTNLNDEEASRIDPNETTDLDAQWKNNDSLLQAVDAEIETATSEFVESLPHVECDERGVILVNPLPWKRQTLLHWPDDLKLPEASSSITDAWKQEDGNILACEVPPGGFLWLTEAGSGKPVKPQKMSGKPLAEPLLLRNQHFEVELSEITGGISSVRFHGQRANRVSQQIAFRYEQSKTVTVDGEEYTTPYAVTRALSSQVLKAGPALGAVETECEVIDVVSENVMCRFRQITSVERHSQKLTIDIILDDVSAPPIGNPWMTYLAARFAWDNESAAISRSMLGRVSGFRMERFEAPDFIEVADSDQRLLILPHGRPYHRRSGRRMLDSLLLVEGETERSFRFTLEFDRGVPMQAALEAASEPIQQLTAKRKPKNADSGWILGISAKNVLVADSVIRPGSDDAATKVVMLMNECEGRSTTCRVRCARQPKSAIATSSDGTMLEELTVEPNGVAVNFGKFQIRQIELSF